MLSKYKGRKSVFEICTILAEHKNIYVYKKYKKRSTKQVYVTESVRKSGVKF